DSKHQPPFEASSLLFELNQHDRANIEKIDYEDQKVLIHYRQWSHRYDEWLGWTKGLQDNQPRPTPVRETRTHTQLSFCPTTLQTPARFKKA
uniref:Chromo domain-containing protein n=1 Tax=Salmo trutta TaxID=8032 RepID=A0A674ASB7_SALTR